MDVSARGETVLAELKLLVALSTQQNHMQEDSFKDQALPDPSSSHTLARNQSPPSSMAVRFPTSRSRAHSTTKSRHLENTDENSFQNTPRNSLGIARTVRRTLSGGLSNILRPFQPPVLKSIENTTGTEVQSQQSGFHKIKRKVSSNFIRKASEEENKHDTHPVKEHKGRKRRNTTVATATGLKPQSNRNRRVRESVCSRNSTISVLEYLAARRQQEDLVQDDLRIPLSEYGRNCHLYGCDTPHIWNPDKNSSCPIIHCDCDPEDRSKEHVHIDEAPLFYKPGGSTSTITPSVTRCASSVLDNDSTDSLSTRQRPINPTAVPRYSSSLASLV